MFKKKFGRILVFLLVVLLSNIVPTVAVLANDLKADADLVANGIQTVINLGTVQGKTVINRDVKVWANGNIKSEIAVTFDANGNDCTADGGIIKTAGESNGFTNQVKINTPASGDFTYVVSWNSSIGSASVTFKGTALSPTPVSAAVELSNLVHTYNGSQKQATVTTVPANLSYSLTYNGETTAPTNAGSYTVVATVTAEGYTGSATDTLTINKAQATVSLSNLVQIYDGTVKEVGVTTDPKGLNYTVTYKQNNDVVNPVNAGEYDVVVTIDDANYEGSATGTLTINKTQATVSLSNLVQIYDGIVKEVGVTTNPEGLNYTVTYKQNNVAVNPVDAGRYDVVVTIADANYEGSAIDTLTINKAQATVSLSNLVQIYDGIVKEVGVTTNPEGLNYTVTYKQNNDVVNPVNAGEYDVVVTIDDANYEGSATGTLIINKAQATVSLSNLVQIYDGTAKEVGVTINPAGLNYTITYKQNNVVVNPVDAGRYDVVVTINDPNYEGSVSDTFKIEYQFGGILQPINRDGSSVFKAGSTVPVKFQLTDANNAFVANAVATIKNAKFDNKVLGNDVEVVSTAASTTGNQFRYDAVSNQYIFNLSTKGLTTGTYKITISLNDGTTQEVQFGLK
jgi:hypothetical protein